MYTLVNFVFFISLICLSQGLFNNGCPEVETVKNFKLDLFGKGVWHQVARYPIEAEMALCWSFEYAPQGDKIKGQVLGAANLPADSPKFLETLISVDPEAGDRGELHHEMIYGYPRKSVQGHEYILAIDYDKYYIGYECIFDEKTKTPKEYAWVVSRTKDIDSDVRAAIDNHIKSSTVLDANKFIWLKKESCQ